ncbi:MAG: leucyl aminopeptidase [Acidobacteriota bacterium]
MKVEIGTENPIASAVDGLLVFVDTGWKGQVEAIDRALDGALRRALSRQMFKGRPGDVAIFETSGKIQAQVIVVAGDSPDGVKGRRAVFLGCRKARDAGVRTLAVDAKAMSPDRLTLLAEMAVLSLYTFDRYRRVEERKEIRSVRVLVGRKSRERREAIRLGTIIGEAACYARDLVNEPPSIVTPRYLARCAVELQRRRAGVRCEVRDAKWMERQGMGGILGVARGSHEEPRFIVIRYRPRRGSIRIALVGKGITFDSGGLDLKTADGMATMKCDMSGAASVLGVFAALPRLRPSSEVIGIIPATENMPGGAAYKPGDILRIMNGKTVEIVNTDAEGRLILADALVYAERQKPDWIIDLATLTGACVIALGANCTGLMGDDAGLKKALMEAADGAGERVWELPLLEEYKETLKSDVADVKNSGYGKDGGAIKAGLFLKEFVESTPWVHLDIAGPAFMEKELAASGKGATGHGVATLLRLIARESSRHSPRNRAHRKATMRSPDRDAG